MDMVLDKFKRDLYLIKIKDGYYERDTGDWIQGKEEQVEFKGALLPLSEKDLKYIEEGMYSTDVMKLYTNISIKNNTYVVDKKTLQNFKVFGAREYNIINTEFKRYFIKRIEDINV